MNSQMNTIIFNQIDKTEEGDWKKYKNVVINKLRKTYWKVFWSLPITKRHVDMFQTLKVAKVPFRSKIMNGYPIFPGKIISHWKVE